MGTAYIETTVTAEEGGVHLFEIECVAQVEYELLDNDLYDFSITDFRFDKIESRWDGEIFRRLKVAEVWCPDDLREILFRFADYNFIQDALIERLHDTGELTVTAHQFERADHHARVL